MGKGRLPLYNLDALQANIDKHLRQAEVFTKSANYEKAEASKLQRILKEQRVVQAQLAAGKYVEGYSVTKSHYMVNNPDGSQTKIEQG